MYFAQINFPFDSSNPDDEAQERASDILGCLWKNGQITRREHPLLSSPQGFSSFVLIPAENSLDNAHNGKWVRQAVERFVACGGSEPCVTLIGEDAESAGPCECKEQSELVLFTTYLAMESPLRCGACFQSVPLYCVPPTYMGEYWDLLNWEADYQACDTLQMHCDTLERAATREMSQLNSSLTQSGLQVCQQIQNLTEKPVYYYLYRNGGRSRTMECKRKCPSCGGEWLLPEAWHKFDFKCEQCHLLSNIAWNVR